MGGIGKTTLAQHIYDHDKVEKHFNMKAWVCVSVDFDILGTTKAILESFTHRTCDLGKLNEVQVQLRDTLAEKKFLLVLDDVWHYGHDGWNSLQLPFGAGAPGSKIIVTTQEGGVVKQMDSIGDLKHLRYLDVSGSRITRLLDIVVTLYNLQVLFLKFCHQLQKLPLNMGRLVNLRHFDITGVHIPPSEEMSLHIGSKCCTSLPPLGQLPFLKNLYIEGMSAIERLGCEFYGQQCGAKPFLSLERLSFEFMPEWEDWSAFETEGVQPFSYLSELSIINCPKLGLHSESELDDAS
ncbi:hypothetical protein ACSBR1_018345 [Camellia fascicularis]